ncbi:alpha/beta hydrolase [Cellulomonas sp. McL0617]|uniref:alpha/beta hydrolase n=1 Tax=Cellulomonas sp. McL0617 TaxID=3415675 RepID=UPI003CF12770
MLHADDAPGVHLPGAVLRELGSGGDWISSWWTVAVVGVLVALTIVWAARRRRRHRRTWPLWICAPLALLLGLGVAVNSYVGYVPDVAAARVTLAGWGIGDVHSMKHGHAHERTGGAGQGSVDSVHIPAPSTDRMPGGSLTWIYTPPGYDASRSTRYPVVYLVHGSPGAGGDWFAAGAVPHTMDILLAHRLVQPMIVVGMDVNGTGPSARDTECLDSTTGGSQVSTYVSRTVVPWVDATYRTDADWQHRTIGGFSSGGFCALDLGLQPPHQFAVITAFDPDGDPGSGGRAMLATKAERDRHDATVYSRTIPLPHEVALFVALAGIGHGQPAHDGPLIARNLRARGQPAVVFTAAGQSHTWNMARAALPHGLVFASAHMPPPTP